MYSRLNDNNEYFVPFIAIYSTREHPFGLVFKFMDHSNLRSYLRNNQDTDRLELVRFYYQICYFPSSHHLDASCWKQLAV